MPDRLVFYFGNGHADGGREDRALLGGKGANLAEMTRMGIPVPPGFTISTAACRTFLESGRRPAGLEEQVSAALARLESDTGKAFGRSENPLLVSVRSGAPISMPGMMETILNLGLNDHTVQALAAASNNERFAFDSYRRFIQMYGSVVQRIPGEAFESLLEEAKQAKGVRTDTELDAADLRALVDRFRALVRERTGEPFPSDPEAQLWGAIEAVFNSWNVPRARAYRHVHGIPDDLCTAVNVVAMVYGNLGKDSGTGVAFTRNPSTGERAFFGEFLVNAQGEDVVAGIRTPLAIERMSEHLPDAYGHLLDVQASLEEHYRDMQDLEFTVERGTLYLLQTRTGKRTAAAAVRIAVEMVDEGLIGEDEAVLRVDPNQIDQLLHPRVDPDAPATVIATGLPASPGAASGTVVFDSDRAVELAAQGHEVILMRPETSPDDFPGMVAARAVVTSRGGMTSHAAVVARGMGKCCVVGAGALHIDLETGVCTADEIEIAEGDALTVDGTEGRILLGTVPTVEQELGADFERLMQWADARRSLAVRANADTGEDAGKARSFGAQGIGLCRTEHMFFQEGRIQAMREMILARDSAERRDALREILPMQRKDFEAIFHAMDGLPVTIRLLDPPLHEFLPSGDDDIQEFASSAGLDVAEVRELIEAHREANPMLGHRGVRLGLVYPEITEMQATAIFEAALAAAADGVEVVPEIMVPLVADVEELRRQRALIEQVAERVLGESNASVPYSIGTMIELPRAALLADQIAEQADFFSFGTNDLTQTTYGISRDDSGRFLAAYIEQGILAHDPFQVLDRPGVGKLVAMATRAGREKDATLKVGICGEHGGEPSSVEFFHDTGLDYVSCSPFRVPVARLAAARAELRNPRAENTLAASSAEFASEDRKAGVAAESASAAGA